MIGRHHRKRFPSLVTWTKNAYDAWWHHSQDAIYFFEYGSDRDSLRWISVNQAACEWLGYQENHLLTLSPLDLLFQEKWDDLEFLQHTIRQQGMVTMTATHLTKDQQPLLVEITLYQVVEKDHQAIFMIARYLPKWRMESDPHSLIPIPTECSALVTAVVEEMRNSLTTIKGFTQLLHEYAEHRHYTSIMQEEIGQMEASISSLFSITNRISCGNTILNLQMLVQEVVSRLQMEKARKVVFDARTIKQVPMVVGDNVVLRQALSQILHSFIETIQAEQTLHVAFKAVEKWWCIRMTSHGMTTTHPRMILRRMEPSRLSIEVHQGKIVVSSSSRTEMAVEIWLPSCQCDH